MMLEIRINPLNLIKRNAGRKLRGARLSVVGRQYSRFGRAMSQAVSPWPLAAEVHFGILISPCLICGGQSDIGTCLSSSFCFLPSEYNSIVSVHTHKSA
jgi:hypothetical protein